MENIILEVKPETELRNEMAEKGLTQEILDEILKNED